MAIGAFDREVIGGRNGSTTGRAVRPEGLNAVTCERCGCRLTLDGSGAWIHFQGMAGADARGCRVDCVELPHKLVGLAAA